jgi:hypothetical protein
MHLALALAGLALAAGVDDRSVGEVGVGVTRNVPSAAATGVAAAVGLGDGGLGGLQVSGSALGSTTRGELLGTHSEHCEVVKVSWFGALVNVEVAEESRRSRTPLNRPRCLRVLRWSGLD